MTRFRKKVIAIAMTLAMILTTLTSMGTAFASDNTATYQDSANILKGYGVLVGDNNGNLMLDQSLKRQDAVVIALRLMGEKDSDFQNYNNPSNFTDITDDNYKPIIGMAQDLGLVEGMSDGTFGFNQYLTAQQLDTILLRALGYEITDQNYDQAPQMADQMGITNLVSPANNEQITRDKVAQMMLNTLNTPVKDGTEKLGEQLGFMTPSSQKTAPVLSNVAASATTTSADTVAITGSVTPATATVMVGQTAATVNSDGSFSANYTLDKTAANGLNNISVVATNDGLTDTKSVAVTYVANVAASVTAAVANDTPVGSVVIASGTNVPFTKIALTANGADAKVTSIKVARTGLSQDADISAIRLFDGSTQKGGFGILNNGVATFDLSYDPILLTAGQTKEITIKADTGATAGRYAVLGVTEINAVNASDNSAATVSATYPLNGATMQTGAITAGTLTVKAGGGASTIVRGAADQAVDTFTLTTAGEKVTVNSITLTRQGSSLDSDIQNVKLYDGATLLGQANSFTGGKATINFTNPLSMDIGTSKSLTLTTTLTAGSTASTNATFAIYAAGDVSATGATSGDSIVVQSNPANAFPVTSGVVTFGAGTLTTTNMTSGVVDATPVVGQNDVTFLKLNFAAAANEGIKINKIRIQRTTTGSGSDNDLTGIKIFDANGNQVGATLSGFSSGYATFDVTGNPIQIAAGTNATYTFKASVTTNATNGNTDRFSIDTTSSNNIDAVGALSNVDVTLAGGAVNGQVQTIGSHGSVAMASGTQNTSNPVRGAIGQSLLTMNLTASGEDVNVGSIMVTRAAGTSTDVANLKLYDGATQVGPTITTMTGTTATFSNLNYIVPANGTKTLVLMGDVPTSATNGDPLQFTVAAAATDVTATGNASTATITPSGSATGTAFSINQGALAVTAATLPAATTYAIGSQDSEFARFYISAQNSNEAMNINSIAITSTGTLASGDVQDIKLFDGSTQIGTTQQLDNTNTATFNLTSPLVVAKGAVKTISVMATPKAGLNAAHTGSFQINANGINATGVTSNASQTLPAGNVAFGNNMSLSAGGALNVTLPGAVAQLDAANLVQGSTGNAIMDLGFTASNSNVEITKIKVTGNAAATANLSNISLWDGTTQIGTTIPQFAADNTAFFVLNTPLVVTQGTDSYKIITVKADANSSTTSTLGAQPVISLAAATDITARTAGTTNAIVPTGTAPTGNTDTITASSVTVVKAAMSTTTPTLGAGIELGRWTVTNNGPKSVTLNNIELTDTIGYMNGKTATLVLYNADTGAALTTAMAWAAGATTDFKYNNGAALGDTASGVGIRLDSGKSINIAARVANVGNLAAGNGVALRMVSAGTTYDVSGQVIGSQNVIIDGTGATSDLVGLK